MTVAELARALGVPETTIRRHLEQGAPRQDGSQESGGERLNLVHYAAWLNLGNDPAETDG
jgi:predicted transcriptional regulator